MVKRGKLYGSPMRRRQFIKIIGGAAVARPFAARAQQSSNKIPVVGVLWHAGSAEEEDVYLRILVKAFNDLGYVDGKNIHLDQRFPAENPELFRKLGQELVDAHPAVLIAITTIGAVTLKKLTSSIPIVFVFVTDPLGFGLVDSLARPGGNATGPSLMAVDLSGKRLELLKQVVPGLSRVALLTDLKTDATRERTIKANQAAAEALGITLWPVGIAGAEDVEPVFAKIVQDHADGVVRGTSGGLFFSLRARIGAAAIAHKLPLIIYDANEMPYGPLLSYGPDFADQVHRAVAYVDKILKGADPADLPVEQPTRLKLVLSQKTAKALNLTFPQSLIVSADEIIE
jgi:putative tryptophan/tyrosine transport system substrate-binding protein